MDTASNEYLRNAVLTASPEQLHLMLYDGAIRFVRQGIAGLEAQDWEAAFNGFSRAQKIVLEMLNSLNYDVDQSLCSRMAGLYHFIYNKLVEAGTQRKVDPAAEALELLEFQRETWILLIEKLKEAPGDEVTQPQGEPGDASSDPVYGSLSVQG
jgi:flagellar protein FliS